MKHKPYNPKSSRNYPRVYASEFLHTAPYNSGKYWKQILIIALIPAAAMVAAAVILRFSWFDAAYLALGTALVALMVWMTYCAKNCLNSFRETVAKGEYVPESTEKSLGQAKAMLIISLLYPFIFVVLIVLRIASGVHGTEWTQTFPVYLLVFPFLFFQNSEISSIVFMPDGFYTGTATGGMYFIPYTKIDAITDEDGRTTKRGETVKIKLFAKGSQFGHDRLYCTELNEMRRRVAACHAENKILED